MKLPSLQQGTREIAIPFCQNVDLSLISNRLLDFYLNPTIIKTVTL